MAMFLKPIPKRSDYPFDPDNPVPKGRQLLPEELRAKYYKVIDPDSKYYVGDPRMQRARHHERDPRRTKHFRTQRADMQEVFEDTRRYVIDEICRGRWYKAEHAEESAPAPDLEAIAAKAAARPGVENDMFSILSNRYGREFKGRSGPPKTDFIGKNIHAAKAAKIGKTSLSKSMTAPFYRGSRPGERTDPTREELHFICSKFVDQAAIPGLMQFLDKAPTTDRIAFVKAFQSMAKTAPGKQTKHQQALAAAQQYKKLSNAGVPPSTISKELEQMGMSLPNPDRSYANSQGGVTQSVTFDDQVETQHFAESVPQRPAAPQEIEPTDTPFRQSLPSEPATQVGGTGRPSTAFINSLSMPPQPGEIPPKERRNEGMFPTHWKPSARVMELKEKLQQILATKHRHLKISFRRFDEDHKGTIDLAELYRVAVEESGIPCTRKELEELWDLFDRDRDGIIKYADYAKTMGNDALDERDYFQIAQRKAAGRYNEAVAFFKDEVEQDKEHFLNKKQETDLEKHLERMSDQTYEKAEDPSGHSNLFTLPEKKFGALFNETHLRSANTVVGTNAHKLRLELTEKLKEHFGNPAAAFARYNKGLNFVSQHTLKKIIKDVGLSPPGITIHEMVSAFDRDFDGNLQLEEWVRLFSDDPVVHGPERYQDPNPLGHVNPDLLYNTHKPAYTDKLYPVKAEYTQTAWAQPTKSSKAQALLEHKMPKKAPTPDHAPLYLGTTIPQGTYTKALQGGNRSVGPAKAAAALDEAGRRNYQALMAADTGGLGGNLNLKTGTLAGPDRSRDLTAQGGWGGAAMLPPRPSTALSATGGFEVAQHRASLQERAATPLRFIRDSAAATGTLGAQSPQLEAGPGLRASQPRPVHRIPDGGGHARGLPRPHSTPPTLIEPPGAGGPQGSEPGARRQREGWSSSAAGDRFQQRPTTATGLAPALPRQAASPGGVGAAWAEDAAAGSERRMRPLSAAGWELGSGRSRIGTASG